jgi:hypothetical protein
MHFRLSNFLYDYALIQPTYQLSYEDIHSIAAELHASKQISINSTKWQHISKSLKLTGEMNDVYWDALTSLKNDEVKAIDFIIILYNQNFMFWNGDERKSAMKDNIFPTAISHGRRRMTAFWRLTAKFWLRLIATFLYGKTSKSIQITSRSLRLLDSYFLAYDKSGKRRFQQCFSDIIVERFSPVTSVKIDDIAQWVLKYLDDSVGYRVLKYTPYGLSLGFDQVGISSNDGRYALI